MGRDYTAYWEMDGSDYDVALTIVKDLLAEDAIADLAFLVQMYVNKERRRLVRAVEVEVLGSIKAPPPAVSTGATLEVVRLPPTKPKQGKAAPWWVDLITPEFREMSLALDSSGKSRVTWGSCTLEQHRQRATFLRKGAERTLATADQHDKIIALLVKERCNSLDELAKRGKAA